MDCRHSVSEQTEPVEHVVVDGDSGQPWVDIFRNELKSSDRFVTEPDDGIYDAINKGIVMARSDIVGILHSDDVFAHKHTVAKISTVFDRTNADIVYGDLKYVDHNGRCVRRWIAGEFHPRKLRFGWMPPHPTLFIRKRVFDSIGFYDPSFKISGDYEFVLRLFRHPGIRVHCFPETVTLMKLGGASNRSIRNIWIKTKEDIRAMVNHGLNPWFTLVAKNVRKVDQFVHFSRPDV